MSRVTVNKRIVRHVARLGVVDAALAAVARDVLAAAKASAPTDSGTYAAGLDIDKGKVDYHVTAAADHSAAVEFGHNTATGGYVNGRHVLARALDSVT
ncbi:MAG: DUF5403 family protein [Stackebrandtia sp.]